MEIWAIRNPLKIHCCTCMSSETCWSQLIYMKLSSHRSFVINMYVITMAWHYFSVKFLSVAPKRTRNWYFSYISADFRAFWSKNNRKKKKKEENLDWTLIITENLRSWPTDKFPSLVFMTFGTKEVFIIRSPNDIVYDSVITTFSVVILRRRCLAVRIDCCTVSCTLSISNFPLYLWTIFEQEFQSIRTRVVAWWTESQRKLYQVLRARGRSLLPQRTSRNCDFCSWFFSDQKRESCHSDSRQKGCKVVRILSSSDQPAIV